MRIPLKRLTDWMQRPIGFELIFGLFVVLGIFTWLSFHCVGYDWGNIQALNEVIFHAGISPSRFPFFSYLYNGGVYLFHDPQAIVTSPLNLAWVHLMGPVAGGHWLAVAYAGIGFTGMYLWLNEDFTAESALLGSLAVTLSLSLFWRVVAGHVIFLLQLTLPFFLYLFCRLEKAKNTQDRAIFALLLALAQAWMIYEPGFHALLYFVFPGLILAFFTQWVLTGKSLLQTKRLHHLGTFLFWVMTSGFVAILLISPKIMAWKNLPMKRAPDPTDGTLYLKDVLYHLFATSRATVSGVFVPGSMPHRWHFIFEVNSALMPSASLLALFGLITYIRSRNWREPKILFGISCIVLSISLASCQPFWTFFQSMTTTGFRVPGRFLALAAFGLSILATFGADRLQNTYPKRGTGLVYGLIILQITFACHWIYRAKRGGTLGSPGVPLVSSAQIQNRFLLKRYCPVGSGCLNTYEPGYENDPYIQHLEKRSQVEGPLEMILVPQTIESPFGKTQIQVEDTQIKISPIWAGQVIDLSLRPALLGQDLFTQPENTQARIEIVDGHLRIHGDPKLRIQEAIVRPRPLFPYWSGVLAFVTFGVSMISLITLIGLGFLKTNPLYEKS